MSSPTDSIACVKRGTLTPASLSHSVMAARRMKNSYLNTISLMCSRGEYPQYWRQGYHTDLARAYPSWYPPHFRAQRLQRSSPGQNHLMETWYHKVRYFLFGLREHAPLESNPISSCAVISKMNLHQIYPHALSWTANNYWCLLPKLFFSSHRKN